MRDVVVADCSGFMPLSSGDSATSTTAVCTAGTVPADDVCQQPRLTNSAMMNATPQVRSHLPVTAPAFTYSNYRLS